MKAATGFPCGAPDLRRLYTNNAMRQQPMHRYPHDHLRRILWRGLRRLTLGVRPSPAARMR